MDDQSNGEVDVKREKTIADLFEGFPYRHFPARNIIYYQGDKIERFYYIISGYVRMYNITSKGNERILAILGPGESLPLIQTPNAQYFYEALTNVEAAYSSYEELIERFLADKSYMSVVREAGIVLMHRMMEQMEVLGSDTSQEKLELAIKFLAKYYGEEHADYKIIKFRLTNQMLADLVNLTRETVSTNMSKFEKSGIIKISDTGNIIVPDPHKRIGKHDEKKFSLGESLGKYKFYKEAA